MNCIARPVKKLRADLLVFGVFGIIAASVSAAENPVPLSTDTNQILERTSFQTGEPWTPQGDLRSGVAIVYGIDTNLPARIETWRDHGYRIHVMTGVAWGNYQDYLYGRFDGINHEDEAQTERNGNKIGHGGDVYYMSSRHQLRKIPVRWRAARAGCRSQGD